MTAVRTTAGLLRVYRPPEPDGRGLVWVHGGGFTAGGLDMPESDWVSRELADRGVTVFAVNYRLAGAATRYPAPSDDVLSAWRCATALAEEYVVSPVRLALGGASAGANLATGAVIRMLAGGEHPLPACVVLAYPTLHVDQPSPSAELEAALAAAPAADRFAPPRISAMYRAYLGEEISTPPVAAVPGLASRTHLSGFPPTLILLSEIDDLRASGEGFAGQLAAARVRVRVETEWGALHGHLNRPGDDTARRSLERIEARLAEM